MKSSIAKMLLEIMERAQAGTVGIEIETDNLAAFRRNFYRLREQYKEHANLSLLSPPEDGNKKIWVVKNEQAPS